MLIASGDSRSWLGEARRCGYLVKVPLGLRAATSAGRLGMSVGVPAATGEGTVLAVSPNGMLCGSQCITDQFSYKIECVSH
jgi:hypothetical protein